MCEEVVSIYIIAYISKNDEIEIACGRPAAIKLLPNNSNNYKLVKLNSKYDEYTN